MQEAREQADSGFHGKKGEGEILRKIGEPCDVSRDDIGHTSWVDWKVSTATRRLACLRG